MSTAETVPGSNTGFTTTFEIMKARGKAIGNVTTSELSDATPAASVVAHLAPRLPGPGRRPQPVPDGDQGRGRPRLDRRAAGRPPARRQPRRRPRPLRADRSTGSTQTVVDYAKSKGYQYVTDTTGLGGVTSVRGQAGARPLRPGQHDDAVRAADRGPDAGRRLADDPLQRGLPARQRAEPRGDDDEGDRAARRRPRRVLPPGRVGASIDKRDHAADLCGQIGETLQLDQALKVSRSRSSASTPTRWSSDRRPLAHEPDRRRHGRHARLLRDGPDRRRRAAARLLRHGQDAARPAAHRRSRAGRGDRAAGLERDGRPRPDGPVPHPDRARAVLAPPLGRLNRA